MQKKLTITIDEFIYNQLYFVIGARNISKFIEQLVKPHVISASLDMAYKKMAQDKQREKEALEWIESCLDVDHETR